MNHTDYRKVTSRGLLILALIAAAMLATYVKSEILPELIQAMIGG